MPGHEILLVFVVMTVDAEQLPIAAVGRIVVVVVILVMNSQLAQSRALELTSATRANMRKHRQRPLAIAFLPPLHVAMKPLQRPGLLRIRQLTLFAGHFLTPILFDRASSRKAIAVIHAGQSLPCRSVRDEKHRPADWACRRSGRFFGQSVDGPCNKMYISNVHLNMSVNMARSTQTRKKLIETASRIFAREGYRDATIAEICRDARANIAAVNYYFGSKADLYEEVWRYALSVSQKAYGVAGREGASAEEWLRAHIRARVLAVFDDGPGGFFPRIMQKEMAAPSAITMRLRDKYLRPLFTKMEKAVGALLGGKATELQVRACCSSIHSQYVILNLMKHARERMFHGKRPTKDEVETVVAQIETFVMAGLKGVRAQTGKGMLR